MIDMSHYNTHQYREICSFANKTFCDLFLPAQGVSLSLYVLRGIIPDLSEKSVYIFKQPSQIEVKKSKKILLIIYKYFLLLMQKTGSISFLSLSITQGYVSSLRHRLSSYTPLYFQCLAGYVWLCL